MGMKPHEDVTLVDKSLFRKDLVVADTVYNPEKTKMIVEAEEAVDIRVLVEERGHAGGVLRALNHAAGKRRGGHFVAEESDGAGTAGAQPAGQTVGQVTEFGGDVADSLGDRGC